MDQFRTSQRIVSHGPKVRGQYSNSFRHGCPCCRKFAGRTDKHKRFARSYAREALKRSDLRTQFEKELYNEPPLQLSRKFIEKVISVKEDWDDIGPDLSNWECLPVMMDTSNSMKLEVLRMKMMQLPWVRKQRQKEREELEKVQLRRYETEREMRRIDELMANWDAPYFH